MKTCDTCGNKYDKTFEIVFGKERYTFDSFECAIHRLAPVCPHCGCRVIGHGVQADEEVYCCAHCASHHGIRGLKDRTSTSEPEQTLLDA